MLTNSTAGYSTYKLPQVMFLGEKSINIYPVNVTRIYTFFDSWIAKP